MDGKIACSMIFRVCTNACMHAFLEAAGLFRRSARPADCLGESPHDLHGPSPRALYPMEPKGAGHPNDIHRSHRSRCAYFSSFLLY